MTPPLSSVYLPVFGVVYINCHIHLTDRFHMVLNYTCICCFLSREVGGRTHSLMYIVLLWYTQRCDWYSMVLTSVSNNLPLYLPWHSQFNAIIPFIITLGHPFCGNGKKHHHINNSLYGPYVKPFENHYGVFLYYSCNIFYIWLCTCVLVYYIILILVHGLCNCMAAFLHVVSHTFARSFTYYRAMSNLFYELIVLKNWDIDWILLDVGYQLCTLRWVWGYTGNITTLPDPEYIWSLL